MANPEDSSNEASRQGGQNPAPRNPGQAPRPRMDGEGPSGGATPVPRQEPESSRPRVAGISPFRPTIQGTLFTAGHVDGRDGDPTVRGGGGFDGLGRGAGGGVTVGRAALQIGGDGGIAQRKRIREGDVGAGPSRPVGDNPLPPPPPPPPGPPAAQVRPFTCMVCRRGFRSDRGLCGHLRTHGDREWRGAFPPPTFSREEFYDAGVGYLLNPPLEGHDGGNRAVEEEEEEEGTFAGPGEEVAGQTSAMVEQGEMVDAATGDQAREEEPPAAGMSELPSERVPLDLNAKPSDDDEEEAMAVEASTSGVQNKLDLNASPPRDSQGNYL